MVCVIRVHRAQTSSLRRDTSSFDGASTDVFSNENTRICSVPVRRIESR